MRRHVDVLRPARRRADGVFPDGDGDGLVTEAIDADADGVDLLQRIVRRLHQAVDRPAAVPAGRRRDPFHGRQIVREPGKLLALALEVEHVGAVVSELLDADFELVDPGLYRVDLGDRLLAGALEALADPVDEFALVDHAAHDVFEETPDRRIVGKPADSVGRLFHLISELAQLTGKRARPARHFAERADQLGGGVPDAGEAVADGRLGLVEGGLDVALPLQERLEDAVGCQRALLAQRLQAADRGVELVGDGLRNQRRVFAQRAQLVALQHARRQRLAELQDAGRLLGSRSTARLERLVDDLCGERDLLFRFRHVLRRGEQLRIEADGLGNPGPCFRRDVVELAK